MSVLSSENQKEVEALLVKEGLITNAEIKKYRVESTKLKISLFTHLIQSKKINSEQLTKATAKATNVPYVNLSQSKIDQNILKLLPKDIAKRFMAVPLGQMRNRLVVAMIDANNVQAVDFLSNKIGKPLKVYLASEEGIKYVIDQYTADLNEVIASTGPTKKDEDGEKKDSDDDNTAPETGNIKTIVQDSPISRALSTILEYAAKVGASDIHVEPLKDSVKIRARIDGVLREVMQLPKSIEPAFVSRVKILANLKIDEHRTPQDGQFTVEVANRGIDRSAQHIQGPATYRSCLFYGEAKGLQIGLGNSRQLWAHPDNLWKLNALSVTSVSLTLN